MSLVISMQGGLFMFFILLAIGIIVWLLFRDGGKIFKKITSFFKESYNEVVNEDTKKIPKNKDK